MVRHAIPLRPPDRNGHAEHATRLSLQSRITDDHYEGLHDSKESFTDREYVVILSPDTTFDECLEQGHYTRHSEFISAQHFSPGVSKRVEVPVRLQPMEERMGEEDIIHLIDNNRSQPATLAVLMALGARYFSDELPDSVVGIGTVIAPDGTIQVSPEIWNSHEHGRILCTCFRRALKRGSYFALIPRNILQGK